MKLIREFWLTLCALVGIIRNFFVRWFLPLHKDEEEPVGLEDEWEEEEETVATANTSDEPIDDVVSDEQTIEEAPPEFPAAAPVIAPPTGAEERVSRTSAAGGAGFQVLSGTEPVEGPVAPDEEPTAPVEGSTASPAPDELRENPFAPDQPGESS